MLAIDIWAYRPNRQHALQPITPMKNTLLVIITATAALFASKVSAQGQSGPSVTVGTSVTDKYLAAGTGSMLSRDPAVQSDLFVMFHNGVYVDLWNSRSLRGSWDNGSFGNEVDYAVGWKGKVAEDVSLNAMVCYFDEPKAFSLGKGDILYTKAFLTKSFKPLSVALGYENYVVIPGSGFRGGNLVSLGASQGWSVREGKVALRASAAAVYDFGTLGTDRGIILRGTVGVDWKTTKSLTVNLIGVNWFVPVTAHDKRSTDVAFSTGVTWNIK